MSSNKNSFKKTTSTRSSATPKHNLTINSDSEILVENTNSKKITIQTATNPKCYPTNNITNSTTNATYTNEQVITINVCDLRSLIKAEIQSFSNEITSDLANRIDHFEKNIHDFLFQMRKGHEIDFKIINDQLNDLKSSLSKRLAVPAPINNIPSSTTIKESITDAL